MSTVETALADAAAGAAAAGMAALGKRKIDDLESPLGGPDAKTTKMVVTDGSGTPMPALDGGATDPEASPGTKKAPMSKAREIRLEQNRKAARESRRRKKTMIEELQRSVIFFSRANSTLKQQNDELSRLLMQSQAQVAAVESGQQPAPAAAAQAAEGAGAGAAQPPAATAPGTAQEPVKTEGTDKSNAFQQAQAQAVATQAVLESQVRDVSCGDGISISYYFTTDVLTDSSSQLVPFF